MAYKFQLGEARMSGSLIQEGALDLKDSAGKEFNLRVGRDDGSVDVAKHNGTIGLKLGGVQVTATAAEINYLDTASPTATNASKAVIYTADADIAIADDRFIGTIADPNMLQFDGGSEINVADDLDFIILKTGGLQLADGAVNSTAAELNLLDGSSAGTVANSKAVIYSAGGNVQGTTFKVPDDGTIGNASVGDAITLAAAEITVKDGVDFSVATVGGFNYGGAAVTSTAAELNLLDTAAAGTAVASKAVIYNATKGINTIQVTSSWYSGGKFTSEVDMNSNNLIGVNDLDVAGGAVFLGNVDLGNATSDTVTFTSRVDSAIVPDADSTRDLGTSALRWRKIYADEIVGADMTLDIEKYGAVPLGYTISASTDFALLTTAAQTYTLPTAVAGKKVDIKLSGSVHNCTIAAASNDWVEGAANILLEATSSAATFVAEDATHWHII